jgi:hypothetical protein
VRLCFNAGVGLPEFVVAHFITGNGGQHPAVFPALYAFGQARVDVILRYLVGLGGEDFPFKFPGQFGFHFFFSCFFLILQRIQTDSAYYRLFTPMGHHPADFVIAAKAGISCCEFHEIPVARPEGSPAGAKPAVH